MNPLRSAPLLLLTALAAPPAIAQDGLPLVVDTFNPQLMQTVTTMLGYDEELPPRGAGESWKLRVRGSGEIDVSVERGLIVSTQIVARPAFLGERLPRQVDAIRTAIQTTYSAALSQCRFEASHVEDLVRAVTEFSSQIARIRVLVRGELGTEAGLTIEFWIVAAHETWLADFIGAVRATPLLVPSLATDGTTLSLRVGMLIQGDHAQELAKPFVEFFSRMSPLTAGGQVPSVSVENFLGSFDGRMAMQWNAKTGSMSFACRMREPSHVKSLVESPRFPEWLESPSAEQSARAKYTPAAADHYALPFYKSVASLDAGANDSTPTPLRGEIVSYGGMAGPYFVGATGASDEEMKQLVEKALGDKFQESILSETVFARIRLRLADYAAQMIGDSESAGLPQRVTVAFGSGTTVRHGDHFHPNQEDPREMFVKVIIK